MQNNNLKCDLIEYYAMGKEVKCWVLQERVRGSITLGRAQHYILINY